MTTIPPGPHRKPDRQQLQAAALGAGLVLPDEALVAMQQGRMIEGIKLIRAANPGLDLARAKAAVERLQAQARTTAREAGAGTLVAGKQAPRAHPQRPPTVAMGDPPGQLRWLLIVLALLAWAGWLVFG